MLPLTIVALGSGIVLLVNSIIRSRVKFMVSTAVDIAKYHVRNRVSKALGIGLIGDTIHYYDGVTPYSIKLKPKKRGPSGILNIADGEKRTITEIIKRYAGPNYDFYQIPTTPGHLGYTTLVFSMMNGVEYTFDENDIIRVSD